MVSPIPVQMVITYISHVKQYKQHNRKLSGSIISKHLRLSDMGEPQTAEIWDFKSNVMALFEAVSLAGFIWLSNIQGELKYPKKDFQVLGTPDFVFIYLRCKGKQSLSESSVWF